MKKLLTVFFMIMLVFQYGCKEKRITYADSGSTVNLKVNQVLIIELPGNPSTGNTWRTMVFDENIILKKEDAAFTPKDDRIGSPGVYHYTFIARAPGKTKLYMEFGPKYDNEKEALKTFDLEVVVSD
ncbi:MAG: protease inhibitor I42 family protein [Bacteroidales bacterium]|nr:protease inhibitor I42 family protein [Bacteroidales bacterium]